jgi:hypothetical protein
MSVRSGLCQRYAVTIAAVLALSVVAGGQTREAIPARLTDDAFWTLVETFSEPSGFFQSDNLVSNERGFQDVAATLTTLKRGGAYVGVAPDQNFTFILALDPKIAFIVDIRRGNLHAHLMYKALFELSKDRAEFLARLFGRPRPGALTPSASSSMSAGDLIEAYRATVPNESVARETLHAIQQHLTKTRRFKLSEDDLRGIEYVHGMFSQFGPGLTYSTSTGRGGRNMPTWGELQSLVDRTGEARAYVGTEANFRAIKSFQEKNLLVPIVGDFAGPKALRAVGKYLADRGATVTVFYTSNVEQYLFQNGVWQAFYANVGAMPIDEESRFLRSARQQNVLDPIAPFLADVKAGLVQMYPDVTRRGGRSQRAPGAGSW